MKRESQYEIYYFVEYIEMDGSSQSDIWSEWCLNHEIELGEVKITHIELAYDQRKALGLVID